MTIAVAPVSSPPSTLRPAPYRLTRTRVWHAEVHKILSTRSSVVTLGATAAVVVGIAALSASLAKAGTRPDAVAIATSGVSLALFVVLALGALLGAREFGTGLIRTTVAAVPRRRSLVVAKALALAAVVWPVVLAAVAVALALVRVLLAARGLPVAALDLATVRTLALESVELTGMALIGLAVGLVVRSTAGAVSAALGLVLVAPPLLGALLPAHWADAVAWLPAQVGDAMTAVGHVDGPVQPTVAIVVFLGWVVASVALAADQLRRRDV